MATENSEKPGKVLNLMFGQAKVDNHRIDVHHFNEQFPPIWWTWYHHVASFRRIDRKHIIHVIAFKADLFQRIDDEMSSRNEKARSYSATFSRLSQPKRQFENESADAFVLG